MWKNLFGICALCFSTSLFAEPNSFQLEDCHLDGIRERVKCGTLSVPENYQQADGPQIEIYFTVIPAIDGSADKTPLMFLAGGPGQAATELSSMLRSRFHEVRKSRDILLVDQRGTGKSSQLKCDIENFQHIDVYESFSLDFEVSEVEACVSQFPQEVGQFHTENAVRDFDAVRSALGHEKINVYGGSYGTRAALNYMRMFPDSLEGVVLDSVAPMDIRIGLFGKTAEASFSKLLENCQADEACSSAFPDLAADFEAVYQQLLAKPIEVSIPHPRLGTPTDLVIDATKFVSNIQMQLYGVKGRSMLPLVIHQAANGNFMPLVGMLAQSDEEQPQGAVYVNVLMTIACSEDYPLISDQDWIEDSENIFARDTSHQFLRLICPHWPQYQTSESLYDKVSADIPTLILSGELDPVTPPAYGDIADEMLPNSRHIVADKLAHIVAVNECGVGLVAQFLDALDPNAVDDSCLAELPAPSFMTSLNGNI